MQGLANTIGSAVPSTTVGGKGHQLPLPVTLECCRKLIEMCGSVTRFVNRHNYDLVSKELRPNTAKAKYFFGTDRYHKPFLIADAGSSGTRITVNGDRMDCPCFVANDLPVAVIRLKRTNVMLVTHIANVWVKHVPVSDNIYVLATAGSRNNLEVSQHLIPAFNHFCGNIGKVRAAGFHCGGHIIHGHLEGLYGFLGAVSEKKDEDACYMEKGGASMQIAVPFVDGQTGKRQVYVISGQKMGSNAISVDPEFIAQCATCTPRQPISQECATFLHNVLIRDRPYMKCQNDNMRAVQLQHKCKKMMLRVKGSTERIQRQDATCPDDGQFKGALLSHFSSAEAKEHFVDPTCVYDPDWSPAGGSDWASAALREMINDMDTFKRRLLTQSMTESGSDCHVYDL